MFDDLKTGAKKVRLPVIDHELRPFFILCESFNLITLFPVPGRRNFVWESGIRRRKTENRIEHSNNRLVYNVCDSNADTTRHS